MEKEFKRVCPQCNKELLYKNAQTYRNAVKVNGLCRHCGGLKKARENSIRVGNLNILLENTFESFYWMGFILADGCFFENRLKITLSIKDKEHLQKFANYISYSIPLKETDINISCSCKNIEISPLICKKFDIYPNKTYNPPKTISNFDTDFQYCLLAGFIDGDGCINNQSNCRKDFTLRIKNHASWLHILEEFNILINGSTDFIKVNNQGYASLIISNTEVLKQLKRRIEGYNLPLMSRKWDIIDYSFQSRVTGSKLLKENLLESFANGLSTKDAAIKYNTSYENAYRIRKKYYE